MSRICSLTCVVCLSVCEFSHLTWVMNESLQSLLLFVFHRQWACCHWHVRQLRGVASPVYYLRKARIIQPWLACILHVRRQYSNDVWQHDCSFIRSSSRDTGLILHQKHLAAEVGLQDLKPVYTIQPVVQLVWQPAVSCKQTSNRFLNGFDNRVERTATVRLSATVRSTRLSNRLYNPVWQPAVYGFDNRLNVCIHDATGCQSGLTTGCIVYTNIYPVVKPVWQQVVSCKRRFRKTCRECYWHVDSAACQADVFRLSPHYSLFAVLKVTYFMQN